MKPTQQQQQHQRLQLWRWCCGVQRLAAVIIDNVCCSSIVCCCRGWHSTAPTAASQAHHSTTAPATTLSLLLRVHSYQTGNWFHVWSVTIHSVRPPAQPCHFIMLLNSNTFSIVYFKIFLSHEINLTKVRCFCSYPFTMRSNCK